jgi:hypothetical protein
MKYAHIFNAPGKKHRLIITSGPSISEGVISEQVYDTKKEAKDAAKLAGAQPWNY